jgi:hypothetical protein
MNPFLCVSLRSLRLSVKSFTISCSFAAVAAIAADSPSAAAARNVLDGYSRQESFGGNN